jgi:hypothetical protein
MTRHLSAFLRRIEITCAFSLMQNFIPIDAFQMKVQHLIAQARSTARKTRKRYRFEMSPARTSQITPLHWQCHSPKHPPPLTI